MFEASKTRAVRENSFAETYLSGSVLDIGCGSDLAAPHAQPFDRSHGDANHIVDFLPLGIQFDCVHSSHCLEHMCDVQTAVAQWWSLVRPGGHMIIVVPHEDLYEQGVWPSIFNADHKATFRLDGVQSWSPVSHNLRALLDQLPGSEIVDIALQDFGYDHRHKGRGVEGVFRPLLTFRRARAELRRLLARSDSAVPSSYLLRLERGIQNLECKFGIPIDQTLGAALAQIQAIVRKKSQTSKSASVSKTLSALADI
jgi:SAM-dependent methyltransferase